MSNRIRSFVLSASSALALFGSAACVTPDVDSLDPDEDVDVAVSELQSGPGEYLVANPFTGEARFFIAVTVDAEPSPEEHELQCKLLMGQEAATAHCPDLASLPVLIVADDGEPAGRVIRVGYGPLAAALASRGHTVLDITPAGEDPEYHPAEAAWSWWTMSWDCVASEADIDTCNSTCALKGGGTVTVDEEIPSNNPYAEPSCEVTCTCGDGTEDAWIDPPQVQPATP